VGFRTWHSALILIFLAAGMLTPGCREEPPVLRVGCQGDQAFRIGLEIALENIERSGSPVRVEAIFDPSGDWTPTKVVRSADAFLRDPGIQAVIGFTSSDASLAAARMFRRHGVPQIIPTGTSPKLKDTGPWTFRLCPNDSHQARFLAETAWNHLGARSCAVVYQNSDYGRGLLHLFRKEFESLGGEITLAALLGSGFNAPDENELYVRHIIEQQPDLLVLFCQPPQASRIQEELVRRQSTLPMLASDSMSTRTMLDKMIERFEGLHLSIFYHPGFSFPGNAEFVEQFVEKVGRPPGYEAALAYDAVMLLHQAVLEGARTREEIRDYLAGLTGDRPPFPGVAGPILFNADQEVERPLHLGLIRDGKVIPDPPEEPAAEGGTP
jgi:branched-chain amino acid transport system substrate-binding protein